MNSPPYVFDVDRLAKIRSELSFTDLEKKTPQNYRLKKRPYHNTIQVSKISYRNLHVIEELFHGYRVILNPPQESFIVTLNSSQQKEKRLHL